MLKKDLGYSVPIVIVIALLLLVIPAYFFIETNNFNSSSSENIRGAQTVGDAYAKPGFSVSITAQAATWDLVEYMCKSLDECISSVTAGSRLGTVSGGTTDLHEVIISYSDEWKDYEYIKFYVRSGWYTEGGMFKVIDLGEVPGSDIYTLSDGTNNYEAVIAPISSLTKNFYSSASFSDIN